jgi:hypothetical protein
MAAAAKRSRGARPSDLIAGYPTATDLAAPDWKALMRDATPQIELLGETLNPILGTPGVTQLLTTEATHGCDIRILICDPTRHLAPLLAHAGIEIRVLAAPAQYTIHRYDQQLLLTLHLSGQDPDQAPLLHLRCTAPEGLFDLFAEHYDDLWKQGSKPVDPELDFVLDEEEDENPESVHQPPTAHETAPGRSELPAPPPRRGPRRPN